ncbi:uncharacterized protein LOC101855579 [Aplysia californica]|uniref:Uncharacterized protein LOC101855579 n=1 Tax=Aplysia californica TaxID=6500 RepID=A0ABM0JW58_APLCA|nr:uncharacterized protein LOC101855579 [Aplysia californica]
MLFGKAAFAFLICLAASEAQLPPGIPKPKCNGGLIPHEEYCQLFYQCDQQGNRVELACQNNTLWSSFLNVCVFPFQARCSTWKCNRGSQARYPDVCCDSYWQCNNGLLEQRNCPTGQTFDKFNGQCSQFSGCQDKEQCGFLKVPKTCNLTADPEGDPRVYYELVTGLRRPCALGTAFNSSTCSCSNLSPIVGLSLGVHPNKRLDPLCRPSYSIVFDQLPLSAYSEKMNANLGFGLKTNGVTVSNGEASLSASISSDGSAPYIYSYFFAANQLLAPLQFTLSFITESIAPGQSFDLVSNAFDNSNNPGCSPAKLRVTVTYVAVNSWRYDVHVEDSEGVFDTLIFTVSAPITSYQKFVFLFSNGQARALVFDLGPFKEYNLTNKIADERSTVELGPRLAVSRCGLTFGEGLEGKIREVSFSEGCGTI